MSVSSDVIASGEVSLQNTENCMRVPGIVSVLGIPIDVTTLEHVEERINESVRTRERLFISTVNLNFVAIAQNSPAFLASLQASDLCTADGIAMLAVCKVLGVTLPERVAGSDFLPSLARGGTSRQHIKVFFFGGTDEAGPRASAAINAMNSPYLSCAGYYNPGFGSLEDLSSDAILERINASGADFLVVSLGAEKGQAWIVRNLDRIMAPVVSHLGATINFLAGTVKRAPPHVQKFGLEWAWRILQEPHLYKRYLKDIATLAGVMVRDILPLRVWLSRGKWKFAGAGFSIAEADENASYKRLILKGAITRDDTARLESAVERCLAAGFSVKLDFADVVWFDLYGAGCVLALQHAATRRGRQLQAINVSSFVVAGLRRCGLGGLVS